MPLRVVVSARSGGGKTTLCTRLQERLRQTLPEIRVEGFLSREVHKSSGVKVGYEVYAVDGAACQTLASCEGPESSERVAKYHVYPAALEALALPALDAASRGPGARLCIIDDIGNMTCKSGAFVERTRSTLASQDPELHVLAAAAAVGGAAFISECRRLPGVTSMTIDETNRDHILESLLARFQTALTTNGTGVAEGSDNDEHDDEDLSEFDAFGGDGRRLGVRRGMYSLGASPPREAAAPAVAEMATGAGCGGSSGSSSSQPAAPLAGELARDGTAPGGCAAAAATAATVVPLGGRGRGGRGRGRVRIAQDLDTSRDDLNGVDILSASATNPASASTSASPVPRLRPTPVAAQLAEPSPADTPQVVTPLPTRGGRGRGRSAPGLAATEPAAATSPEEQLPGRHRVRGKGRGRSAGGIDTARHAADAEPPAHELVVSFVPAEDEDVRPALEGQLPGRHRVRGRGRGRGGGGIDAVRQAAGAEPLAHEPLVFSAPAEDEDDRLALEAPGPLGGRGRGCRAAARGVGSGAEASAAQGVATSVAELSSGDSATDAHSEAPLHVAEWLQQVDDGRGYVMRAYGEAIGQRFFLLRELVDVYVEAGGCVRADFFHDFGVTKVGHQRLFEKWFRSATLLGLA